MVSAFGGTIHPTSEGKNAATCAAQLADFVQAHNVDGVDLDYEDNAAMQAGTGADWIIEFTRILRQRLPNHIITHAPQAPYFSPTHYGSESYLKVHNQVGSMIDFYNVQFYNQGSSSYDTYDKLFFEAGGYFPTTSVSEMIASGIPS